MTMTTKATGQAKYIVKNLRSSLLFVAFVISVAFAAPGMLAPLDRTLQEFRFTQADIAASGEIVFVGIDKKALDLVGVWPWPRSVHGQIIESLLLSNVSEVAVDIDFSTPSLPDQDAQLARVLAASDGRVILPVFRQQVSVSDKQAVTELSQPLPQFAEHVWLGAVNVSPEADGRIWSFFDGVDEHGVSIPSMPALLTGQQHVGSMLIEYGIRADTVPVVSAADILSANGKFRGLEGKKVIYGAFATELGDMLPTPVYGTLSGPMVQLLAAETALSGRNQVTISAVLPITILALFGLFFHSILATNIRAFLAACFVASCITEVAAFFAYIDAAYVIQTAYVHLSIILAILVRMIALTNFVQNLANHARADANKSKQRVEYLSRHNELTGGLRRGAFVQTCEQLLNRSEGESAKSQFVMGVFRIERLDTINIAIGTSQTQTFILNFFDKLSASTAKPIAVGHVESATLCALFEVAGNIELGKFCRTIQEELSEPVYLERASITPTLSCGFSSINSSEAELEKSGSEYALDCAEIAFRFAVQSGDRLAIFDDRMSINVKRNAAIESSLPEAWRKGEMMIYYQPQICIKTGSFVGVECLLRWEHPQLGAVSPMEFVPIADMVGLLPQIDMFVLRRAAQAALHLPDCIGISVNIAPAVLAVEHYAESVIKAISELDLNPQRLTLEVLETAALNGSEIVKTNIEQLHETGIKIALDDFGTGNAAMENLLAISFDKVKLDRAFVSGIDVSQKKQAVLQTTRTLCDAFNSELICEGVETKEELAILRLGGCDIAQGYYYAKPLSFDAVLAFAQNHRTSGNVSDRKTKVA